MQSLLPFLISFFAVNFHCDNSYMENLECHRVMSVLQMSKIACRHVHTILTPGEEDKEVRERLFHIHTRSEKQSKIIAINYSMWDFMSTEGMRISKDLRSIVIYGPLNALRIPKQNILLAFITSDRINMRFFLSLSLPKPPIQCLKFGYKTN